MSFISPLPDAFNYRMEEWECGPNMFDSYRNTSVVLDSHNLFQAFTKPAKAVYHILNPNTSVHWKDVFGGLEASGVSFERADKNEWVQRLADSDEDGKKNPAMKALPFFHMICRPSHRNSVIFLTEETTKIAPILEQAPAVNRFID